MPDADGRISAEALERLIDRCCVKAVQVGPHQAGRRALEELNALLAELVGRLIGRDGETGEPLASFGLLMFTFGEEGWASWASNSDRGDMIKAMREMADTLESKGDLQ